MGITGLLPFIKKSLENSHLKQFAGSTVAVDGNVWLYKGAIGCAQKLGTGESTAFYVSYFLKYTTLLKANGLRPIILFDGRSLPSKEITNKKRRESREENLNKGKEALRAGKNWEAKHCFQRAIGITPEMVREVVKALRKEHVDYMIFPYEADAQLAYLANSGIADLIITEDSDLVIFGASKICFKLGVNGDGIFYDLSKLHLCLDQSLQAFDFERFRQMCIFSGCDYLESISGVGLARARKLFTLSKHREIELILKDAANIIGIQVAQDYISEFQRAENTFRFQLVFDPKQRQLCPLTPYPDHVNKEELSYCCSYELAGLSLDLALGNVDLRTLQCVDHFDVDDPKMGYCTDKKSMWSLKRRNSQKVKHVLMNAGILRQPVATSTKAREESSPSPKRLRLEISSNGQGAESLPDIQAPTATPRTPPVTALGPSPCSTKTNQIVPTKIMKSRFFTPGSIYFLGNKNHPLYSLTK